MNEDKRLERLFDYTKFHIGVYLTIGGGFVAILSAAISGKPEELKGFVGCPLLLFLAAIFMGVAGLAGGVVASSATQHLSWRDLWEKPQGPYRMKWLTGENWAAIEHLSFWLSVVLASLSFLTGKWASIF